MFNALPLAWCFVLRASSFVLSLSAVCVFFFLFFALLLGLIAFPFHFMWGGWIAGMVLHQSNHRNLLSLLISNAVCIVICLFRIPKPSNLYSSFLHSFQSATVASLITCERSDSARAARWSSTTPSRTSSEYARALYKNISSSCSYVFVSVAEWMLHAIVCLWQQAIRW